MAVTDQPSRTEPGRWNLIERVHPAWWAVGFILLVMPLLANDFWLFQVFGWTFILGMIALSMMFLAGYGGMVSLIQMSVAALGGYMVAILGTSGVAAISQGLPWWVHVPAAIVIAAAFGTLVGALAVRTEGIYTIMITLAIASAFYYFSRQNYGLFNGYSGFNLVVPPMLFGVDWRGPAAFYYLTLGCAVLSCPMRRWSMCPARRLALPCRACATTRAGWRPWAIRSTHTGLPPIRFHR